jgi:hypothetical protein
MMYVYTCEVIKPHLRGGQLATIEQFDVHVVSLGEDRYIRDYFVSLYNI